ncbi:unnamed protein product [Phyllotreta striolata]|uniref:Ig-like domain-containing protein n=1 Tax=Phyllotreta striolata TaxID=444603 RepID=A0A9N9TR92_PHYSR|nr:unnamed protein product [Phyllotreta striolata]
MASVYKYRKHSLESAISMLLLTLTLFVIVPLTTSLSTNGSLHRMQQSGKENLTHIREKRRPVDAKTSSILPKRRIPVVKAQTRSRAKLHCNISEINEPENLTLTWTKKTDNNEYVNLTSLQLEELTNNETITVKEDDKRYLAIRKGSDWCLHIRYTLNSDGGSYQCQICHGFPPTKCSTSNVVLKLIEAHAKIIGGPTKFIPSDKELPLRLSCVLVNSIEAPSYIFWYHEDRMINYDLEDGATVREGPQGSELIFPKPNKTHVGNYSCVPSNAQLDSVMVYYGGKDKLIKEWKKLWEIAWMIHLFDPVEMALKKRYQEIMSSICWS